MKKVSFFSVLAVAVLVSGFFVAAPFAHAATINVSNLQPDWVTGGGVYSAYYGPLNSHVAVSPGTTAVYAGRGAGIIKAGQGANPGSSGWDEGLFGFKPTVTIDVLAAGTLTYDVQNQFGVNPVWMTIEIDTGATGEANRSDNTVYQFVPTTNPISWHTVDAGAGQWQQWTTYLSGVTTGPLMTLSQVAAAHTGLNVVRTYLRLGMGSSYYNGGTGTTAWVDKATLGGVTYNFVVVSATPSPTDKNQCKNNGWKTFTNPSFKNQGQCVSFVEKQKDNNKDHHDNDGDDDRNHGNKDHHDDHEGNKENKHHQDD